jgi:hypothetical protein
MASNWSAIRVMSRWSLVLRLGMVGALAGIVAWAVVLAAHVLFGVSRPSWIALLLAIPRGAFLGIVLALILHAFWNRGSGRSEPKEGA